MRKWYERNVNRRRFYTRAARQKLSQRVNAIKLERGCADCGYRGHPVALDFDHVDPATKEATVSQLVKAAAAWARVEAEMAKCEVVCANCHRIRTWDQTQDQKDELDRVKPPILEETAASRAARYMEQSRRAAEGGAS